MLRKIGSQKIPSISLGEIAFVLIAVSSICYLLYQCKNGPFSIHSIASSLHRCAPGHHILVIGLLPVYVALIVFGSALFGIYLGSLIQRYIARRKQNQSK